MSLAIKTRTVVWTGLVLSTFVMIFANLFFACGIAWWIVFLPIAAPLILVFIVPIITVSLAIILGVSVVAAIVVLALIGVACLATFCVAALPFVILFGTSKESE